MIAALIPALLPILGDLIDRVIPDPAEAAKEKARIETELLKQAHDGQMAQIELNKVEAQHGSVFVAGWRPFIGWCCGVGFLTAVLILPIANMAMAMYRSEPMPQFPVELLMVTMGGMLGLGGLRTFEKIRGVTVNMPGSVNPAAVVRPVTADELNAASLARARNGRG